MIQEAKEERRERLASRPERPRGGERRRRSGRRGRGRAGAADGSTAEVRFVACRYQSKACLPTILHPLLSLV